MAIYRKSRVLQSTCFVTLSNESVYAAHAVLNCSNENTAGLNVSEAMGNPFQVNTMISPTGGPAVKLVRSVRTAEVIGVPEVAIQSDDAYSGGVAASPAKQIWWLLTV